MEFHLWLTMLITSLFISISPGCGAITTINSALNYGFKRSYAAIIGLQVGYLVQIIIVCIGLGGVIAASAALYNIIKWFGVLYLIYLGISSFRASAAHFKHEKMEKAFKFSSLFIKASLVNLTNPKATIFLLAFIPQFLSLNKPEFTQIVTICATLIGVDLAVMSCYGVLGSTMKKHINNEKFMRVQNRLAGLALITAALFLSGIFEDF
ncbi:MAG: LysE family transporter [Campylobacteraceae bacterium]|jgi:homoserine/homoserine lactone efflux protein|nr:LysE family transporter [Campylobacteraceae bacterium]